MQPVAPAPARHQPSRELVHDDDLAVLDHVVHVELEQCVRPQRLVDVVEERHVDRVVEAVRSRLQAVVEHLLGLRHAGLGQLHGLVLLVDQVVAGRLEPLAVLGLDVALGHGAGRQLRNDPVHLVVELGGLLGWTGDDERRARFVDQDAVHLVDDGEVVPALDEMLELELHVVAQVVEAELVVRAVGDVAPIRDLPLGVVQLVLDHADAHAEEPVDPAHPLRVASRQVVVHRDDVHALALERVQIGGQSRDERLAFARFHLRDPPLVQHHAAEELDVEVPHVQHAPSGLAHDPEGLRQQIVQRLATLEPLAEFRRPFAQRRVRELAYARLELVDAGHERTQLLQLTLVLRADDLGQEGIDHGDIGWRGRPPDGRLASDGNASIVGKGREEVK